MDETTHQADDFRAVVDEMTASMASVRELLTSLREKQATTSDFDTRDGISLLSLKPHLMMSYIQSLALLSARRALGESLQAREPPSEPFSDKARGPRGSGTGDLVDALVEGRAVLEKIRPLEDRMRYQIDKLVRMSQEGPSKSGDVMDDPLAFRPNPQALMDAASEGEEDEVDRDAEDAQGDGIYRPPKLAPMPYNESGGRKDKRERRRPVPAALANLAYLDPSRPHLEGTSGLGAAPASSLEAASSRAREIRRMTEFEEENFTRLVLKKKDERQRRRDEEDIALGGVPTIARAGRRRGGLEDEFGDVLRSVGRSARAATGDGYEELRQRGRKDGVLARSRKRPEVEEEQDEGPKMRKRSRFDREAKAVKKRTSLKRK